jgi:hypothetical protein
VQHYKLLLQELGKRNASQIEAFKTALRVHAEHVKERQKRVTKYGQGHEQLKAASGLGSTSTSTSSSDSYSQPQSYAMFSRPNIALSIQPQLHTSLGAPSNSSMSVNTAASTSLADYQKSQELRRRGGTNTVGGITVNEVPPPSSPQAQKDLNQFSSSYANGKPPSYMAVAGGTGMTGGASRALYGGSSNYYNSGTTGGSSTAGGGGGGTGGGGYHMMEQTQLERTRNDSRLQNAEKVEAAIAQMGRLFSQMASLVLEQSETLARIEDDVEIGLTDTQEAHKSMERFYEITKGNRGMIIKIFALLVFFILVFLVWT